MHSRLFEGWPGAGGWRDAKRLGANPRELCLQHPETVFDVEAEARGHPGFQALLPLAFRSPGRAGGSH